MESPDLKNSADQRCQGPNADSLLVGKYQEGDDLSTLIDYLQISGLNDDDLVTLRTAKRVVQPTAVRLGAGTHYPKTPMSERSVSAHLEDGSSSVSSFSTLVSNITSPDTSKMAHFLVSKDFSAFKSLDLTQTRIPILKSVYPIRQIRAL